MLSRFEYELVKGGSNERDYYIIKDNLDKNELILFCDENECEGIIGLMNTLNKNNINLSNELDRVHECFIDLDILIGTLSWYVDERCDDYGDMEKLKHLSSSLSKSITRAMYPQVSKRFEEE